MYQKKEHKKLRRVVKKLLQTDNRLKSYGQKECRNLSKQIFNKIFAFFFFLL
jgi:hypothetical protein